MKIDMPAAEDLEKSGIALATDKNNAEERSETLSIDPKEHFGEMPAPVPNKKSANEDENEHQSESNDSTPALTNHHETKENQIVEVRVGMVAEVKNLYEGKEYGWGDATRWVDKYPDDWEEPVENSETARYALIIRNKKSYDARKKLRIHSIVIQSTLLKVALHGIFRHYPGIYTYLDRLTFDAPFKPFVHRWEKLVATFANEKDPATRAHLELFHGVMAQELEFELKERADYILNGVITFETCWMIFPPGTIVLVGGSRALRVKESNETPITFNLICERVDWDGEEFGLGLTQICINAFSGTRAITGLEAFPIEYHQNQRWIEDELREQGKAFAWLSGYHYKHYNGVAFGKGPWGPVSYNVDHHIFDARRIPLTPIRSTVVSSSIPMPGIGSIPMPKYPSKA